MRVEKAALACLIGLALLAPGSARAQIRRLGELIRRQERD